MKKQCILYLFLMLPIALFAQEQARGYVYDKVSKMAVVGAEVKAQYDTVVAITNEDGEFALDIPKGNHNIIISKKNYYTLSYVLNSDFLNKPIVIYLTSYNTINSHSKSFLTRDSLFMTYKNAVSLSIIELFAVAIAMRYEHFLTPKHAVGLHGSYYISGRGSMDPYVFDYYNDSPNGSTYTGFKAALFYRYYLMRKKTMGLYAEAKIPFGYFDFDYIWYEYSHRTGFANSASYSFWTFGGGISFGVMTRMPKTKQGVMNFSIGYQYFPTPTPQNYIRQNGNGTISILKADTDWWYKNGPGGRFEVKLTLGGIF